MRKKVALACSECGSRNYTTMSKKESDRLELKKYCETMSGTYDSSRNEIEGFYIFINRLHFSVGGYKMQRIVKFFREVGREMKKVSWPKRKELTNYTVTVLATVVFFTAFFAVIDLGISKLIRLILE